MNGEIFMKSIPPYLRVKFGEEVWHDESNDRFSIDFFDRREAKEQTLAILRSPETRRAVWVIGERRAGKTSMLKLMLEKCKKEGFLAIEIPWQSIHSIDDFYKEFLFQLVQLGINSYAERALPL
jgi:predicted AAA+ superfamily ATPase